MAVDGTGTTQNLAAWERDFAIINVGTGRGFIAPIQLRVIDGLVESGWDFDEDVIVLAAATLFLPDALSRLASTQPAAPAPTIT
jgi:hypothetical protein